MFFAENRRGASNWGDLAIAGGILLALLIGLIAKQPDLGTAVTLIPVFVGAAFAAGMRLKVLAILALVAVVAAPVAWTFALKDYQKSRIRDLSRPEQDSRGAGYQQIQARITVGLGPTARGICRARRGNISSCPVAHNDFIYSVLGEELGFIGVSATLGLYLLVILRALDAARLAKDRLGGLPGGGPHHGIHVPGDLQHHHVRGTGAGQRADAAAHELRRLIDHRNARRFRPRPERQDAALHELTATPWRPPPRAAPRFPRTTDDITGALGSSRSRVAAGHRMAPARAAVPAPAWQPSAGGRVARLPRSRSMTKEMIVSSNDYETRVAILEDDEVTELFIERERQRGVVGNVYKGRVSKVLPGMQSAFIQLGLERDGFLYVSDVVNTLDAFEQLESGGEDEGTAPAPDEAAPAGGLSRAEGGSVGRVRREPRHLPPGTDGGRGRRGDPRGKADAAENSGPAQQKIEDLLREGEETIVQVAKEPLGTKGARLTSHVTIPGRFLVFMPTVDHLGVSRKIDDRAERRPVARDRPPVPGTVRVRGRPHHPDRRRGPSRGRHRGRPQFFHEVVGRDPQAQVRRRRGRPPPSTASRASWRSCCATC